MTDSIRSFFTNTVDEMRKSSWPTRDQLFESTILVIVALAVSTAFITVVDQVLFKVVKYLTTF
ncbi:MAG: preprotein translocase subunit SecE [Lentisphaeria bacterium]|nr:preprotein translocase subunit SecE [Lentisphaeria bacterium]